MTIVYDDHMLSPWFWIRCPLTASIQEHDLCMAFQDCAWITHIISLFILFINDLKSF